jgi:hypothetical protein
MSERASERIAFIRRHVERVHYLTGVDALSCATTIYLDEQQGYGVPPNHPLRLAEKAAGFEPLQQAPPSGPAFP